MVNNGIHLPSEIGICTANGPVKKITQFISEDTRILKLSLKLSKPHRPCRTEEAYHAIEAALDSGSCSTQKAPSTW